MGKHVTVNLSINTFDITTNPFTINLSSVDGKSYSRCIGRVQRMGVRTTNNRLIFRIINVTPPVTDSYNINGASQNDIWGTERHSNDDRTFSISSPTNWLSFNSPLVQLGFGDEQSFLTTPIPITNINGFITMEFVLFQ